MQYAWGTGLFPKRRYRAFMKRLKRLRGSRRRLFAVLQFIRATPCRREILPLRHRDHNPCDGRSGSPSPLPFSPLPPSNLHFLQLARNHSTALRPQSSQRLSQAARSNRQEFAATPQWFARGRRLPYGMRGQGRHSYHRGILCYECIAPLAVARAIPHPRLVASAVGGMSALGEKDFVSFFQGHNNLAQTTERT